jgi:hypothetical protein
VITKAEIKQLIANKQEIIDFKKSQMHKTDPFSVAQLVETTTKELHTHNVDDLDKGEIKRTIIANTYNWLDSHGDVHIDGVFSASIKQRQDKILHLHDHLHQLGAKVGKPQNVAEKSISWRDLGVDKAGTTQAVFMDSLIQKDLNPMIFKQYLEGEITQHSVGMQYVKIVLAINDPEEKEEFAAYEKYIDRIGNADKAEEQGFFWAVLEAKLIEISAVIQGSNELTPTIPNAEKTIANTKELKKQVQFLMHEAPTVEYKSMLKDLLAQTLGKSVAETITTECKPSKEDEIKAYYLHLLT